MALYSDLEATIRQKCSGTILFLNPSQDPRDVLQHAPPEMNGQDIVAYLESEDRKRWISLLTDKSAFSTNRQVWIQKYSGKAGSCQYGPTMVGAVGPEYYLNQNIKERERATTDQVLYVLYHEIEKAAHKGFTYGFESWDAARAGIAVSVRSSLTESWKLKAEENVVQACGEIERYVRAIKERFDTEHHRLAMLFIEYSQKDKIYVSRNPWRRVLSTAARRLEFVKKINCIDPYGSGDGGTICFEFVNASDKDLIELHVTGSDAKPTGKLEKNKIETDTCILSQQAVVFSQD